MLPTATLDELVRLCKNGGNLIPALFQIDDINAADSNGELPLVAAVKAGIYLSGEFIYRYGF